MGKIVMELMDKGFAMSEAEAIATVRMKLEAEIDEQAAIEGDHLNRRYRNPFQS